MAETLLQCVPFVLDFLDIDNTELLESGILDGSAYDDDITACILLAMQHRSENGCENGTTNAKSRSRYSRVVPMYRNCREDDYRKHFRMNKALFKDLLQFLENHTGLKQTENHPGTPQLSSEIRLYITLNYLGSRKSTKQLAKMYHVSESSVLSSIRNVVSSIYQVMQSFIKWPDQQQILNIADSFHEQTGLPQVVGVIDVCHIHVRAPASQRDYYTNPKGKLSIILQAVCDHQMKFMHCCTGWPGSIDDASVFHDSDLYMDVSKRQCKYFPLGHYLVADSSYPLQDWLLTPFDNVNPLDDNQLKFNEKHKATQEVMQKAFTHLKTRFPRLHYIDLVEMEDVVKVILVCCALHNFCNDAGDNAPFDDVEEKDEADTLQEANLTSNQKDGIMRRLEITQLLTMVQNQ